MEDRLGYGRHYDVEAHRMARRPGRADHPGELVTIEVLDPEVGYQHEAERLPFSAITYDPADDVVIISVGGRDERYPVVLRHMVWHPVGVGLSAADVPQPAVRVVEPDSTTTLVVFYPA
jgi:hypothetical protein